MKELPLDHIALRVKDRDAALRTQQLMGYTKATEFRIHLDDGSVAESYALVHPSSVEMFLSSGPAGSYIDNWVEARGGVGAVHHLAYAVDDVAAVMREWSGRGIEFCSDEPIVCPCERPLTQVFTKPNPTTGLIYELITRNGHPGFCEENVKRLMNSAPD